MVEAIHAGNAHAGPVPEVCDCRHVAAGLVVVIPLPTVDQVADTPDLVLKLPADALRKLSLRALLAHQLLVVELLARPAPAAAPSVRLLTTEDVAALTGRGRNWVLAHKDALGAIQTRPGTHPRYPSDRVEDYISGRAADGHAPTRKGA